MKIIEEGSAINFFFSRKKILRVDMRGEIIEYWEGSIPFSKVMGYWKNYRPRSRKFVYYVMLLTREKLHKITPEMRDEKNVEKILDTLKNVIPLGVER